MPNSSDILTVCEMGRSLKEITATALYSQQCSNLDYRCDIWNEQNKIYINHFKHDHNSSMSKNNTKTSFSKRKVFPFDKGIIRCC